MRADHIRKIYPGYTECKDIAYVIEDISHLCDI
jgi:hypothetical protein